MSRIDWKRDLPFPEKPRPEYIGVEIRSVNRGGASPAYHPQTDEEK